MNKILSNIDSNFRGLVISSEINKHLNEYYYSLSESEYSYNKIIDITTFIEYVLRLIANAVDYMLVKRYVKLSDTDRLILNKLNRDGMTVSKISKVLGMEKSKARYSVNKLVDNKMICVDKSGKEYRYYRLE